MRRIAILNQKGGVGKTTTTVNLAAALARLGYRVLVLDMDPQAHATLHFGVDPTTLDHSMYELLTSGTSLREAVRHLAPNLSLVGSHIDLAAAEVELVGVVGREVILRDLLRKELSCDEQGATPAMPLRCGATAFALTLDRDRHEPPDFLLMDCPPSLGILTLNALTAANEVLIPLQPHFLALHGMSKLLETIALVHQRINRQLRVTGVVLCMVETNTKLAAEVEADLRDFLERRRDSRLPWAEAVIFDTRIRRNIRLAECPSHGKTIFEYAPTSNGARDYFDLALELVRRHEGEHDAATAPTGAGVALQESARSEDQLDGASRQPSQHDATEPAICVGETKPAEGECTQ